MLGYIVYCTSLSVRRPFPFSSFSFNYSTIYTLNDDTTIRSLGSAMLTHIFHPVLVVNCSLVCFIFHVLLSFVSSLFIILFSLSIIKSKINTLNIFTDKDDVPK